MSEIELPPVAFTVDEVQALSEALTAAVGVGSATDPGLRSALRKLAATVMCADERPSSIQPALFEPVRGERPGAHLDAEKSLAVTPFDEWAASPWPRPVVVGAGRPQAEPTSPARDAAPSNVVALRPRTRGAERVAVDEQVRETIEQAVRDRRVVRIDYTDGRGTAGVREIEPAGILAASGRWTVIGWCRMRQEGRGFRLDRISAAEITGTPAPDRDLAAVLGPLGRPAQAR